MEGVTPGYTAEMHDVRVAAGLLERDEPGHLLLFKLRRARKEGNVKFLLQALDDPIEGWTAADYLADLGATEAIDRLGAMLAADEPEHRAAAARALGRLRASSYAGTLRAVATEDPSAMVRAHALHAIGDMQVDTPERLYEQALQDRDWRVRGVAIKHLGEVGGVSDISKLKEARCRDGWINRGAYQRAIRTIRSRHR